MSANQLTELQHHFRAYLLDKNLEALPEHIQPNETLSVSKRCDIYYYAYRARLIEMLEKDFPNFKRYVGDKAFEKLANHYVSSHPSRHFSIAVYGDGFPDFVATQSDISLKEAAGLAKFDWAIDRCTELSDAPALSFEQLTEIAPDDWPTVCFELHPSVIAFDVTMDVVSCWQALEEGKSAKLIQLTAPCLCLIWCGERTISRYLQLSGIANKIIKLIQEKQSFANICEALCDDLPEEEIASSVIGLLREWMDSGLFSQYAIV